MATPNDRKYAKTHEWVKIQGDTALVGITDHAQEELGDIVFVEMPAIGDDVTKGGETATVESVKASSPIYSPVSGKITGTNKRLDETPELLNKKPYDEHIFTITGFAAGDLEGLLDADAYDAFVASEAG